MLEADNRYKKLRYSVHRKQEQRTEESRCTYPKEVLEDNKNSIFENGGTKWIRQHL